ncbi:G patch domain-containing protein 1 homolog [Epargyreus clarus]|uniref:G patch domain-containing protein 1 homolog n=1 Tax=Epargyreus clarus TaxID=520877 RepID=UPI003C2DE008
MSSSESEDENIRYGTPLDPYEEDDIPSKRKYQEQSDQYAVDDHGRRRFHGAFTGGFSAGYGNTVGTPEGWTPSTFKSSRSDKAQFSSQRPEDFMDDEDRSEYGIAPRQLQTSHEFSGRKRPSQQRYHDGPIPGEPVLEQLVRAVHESAAVRMLRAMGWREGQGTGDRVTRREKKRAKDQHKVYGCYMPPELRQSTQSDEESTDSEFEYSTLFAPDDYEPYILRRKDDRFGLGYRGLSRHSVLGNLVGEYREGSSKSHLVMREKGKKVSIRGQAFGVGAFEADDEDIYATEDMSHYDFTMGGPDKSKDKKKVEKGSNVLEGFVKATNPLPPVASYPAPALPRDYAPAPAGSRRSRFEPALHPQRDQGLGRHELTAEARGKLLGETPRQDIVPPKPTPTPTTTTPIKIIDFTTPIQPQTDPKEQDFISIKNTEGNAVFRPFVTNPEKQKRYERYLQDKESVMLEQDSAMDRLSEWERDREMIEFEQAAQLYKPLTGVMNDRFTHASEPDDALNPLCAVSKSSTNYGLATPEQIEAAKIGAYGVITRREASWRPEALVCKRFNVPEIGGNRPQAVKEDKPKLSYSIFSYLESSVHDKESFTKEQTKFSGSKSRNTDVPRETPRIANTDHKDVNSNDKHSKNEILSSTGPSKRMTVAELFLKESEEDLKSKEQGTVTDTIEKFDKMDLYKSIFLSDSENEEETPKVDSNNASYDDFVEKPKNVERNLSPPRGIFANIDFDEINSWKRKTDSDKNNGKTTDTADKSDLPTTSNVTIEKSQLDVDNSDLYGPKIPDNLAKRLQSVDTSFKPTFRSKDQRDNDDSSSSDSWVDAKEVKVKKHKKDKKKHKKHKSKHKKSKSKKKDR